MQLCVLSGRSLLGMAVSFYCVFQVWAAKWHGRAAGRSLWDSGSCGKLRVIHFDHVYYQRVFQLIHTSSIVSYKITSMDQTVQLSGLCLKKIWGA